MGSCRADWVRDNPDVRTFASAEESLRSVAIGGYLVSRYIQRIDNDLHYLHGWQVRYKGSSAGTTHFYADGKCDGIDNALESRQHRARSVFRGPPQTRCLPRSREERGKLRIGIVGARG